MARQQRDGEGADVLQCIEAFACDVGGVPMIATLGELVAADDPRVACRPFAFAHPAMTTEARRQQLIDVHGGRAVA